MAAEFVEQLVSTELVVEEICMTFEQLLVSLRTKLLDAREKRDDLLLQELASVFTILEEIALEEKSQRDLIVAIIELGDAARDGYRDAWRSKIPTENTLREVAKL